MRDYSEKKILRHYLTNYFIHRALGRGAQGSKRNARQAAGLVVNKMIEETTDRLVQNII